MTAILLQKLDRRFKIMEEGPIPASWKDPYSPEYDRQVAEDALYHTIGPLTTNPRWADRWTSESEPVEGFQPGGPAPQWKPEEVVMAYAGDPNMLFMSSGNPRSPLYGRLGGSPLYRMARKVARYYGREKDRPFIADLYGNGMIPLVQAMQRGADQSRSAFIPWITRNVQSAMEHGVGSTGEAILAKGGETLTKGGKDRIANIKRVMKATDPNQIRKIADSMVGDEEAFGQTALQYADALQARAEAAQVQPGEDAPVDTSEIDSRISELQTTLQELGDQLVSQVSSESGRDIRGLTSLLDETNPATVRQAASVVKGKYQTQRSHDKVPENPFGPFSSAYYQTVTAYADALEAGDEDRVEAARNRIRQLLGEIEDWEIPIRGASSGLGSAISTKDRLAGMRKGAEGQTGPYLKISSMDVPAGEGEASQAGNIEAPTSESWLDPEQVEYVLGVGLEYDVRELLAATGGDEAKKIIEDSVASIERASDGKWKVSRDSEGNPEIGGTISANELRFIIRSMGQNGANYPGRGVPRANTKVARDAKDWWRPGEDPEIEPLPGKPGMWRSVWDRSGNPYMGPSEIAEEMAQECLEFERHGIPSARLEKVKKTGAALTKVSVSNQTNTARVKLTIIGHMHRRDLGLESVRKSRFPLLEGLDSIDAYIIAETCDQMVRLSLLSEETPEGWEGTVRAMKGHHEIDNPYALANWMKNKGAKPHYKDKGGKPSKKKKYANEGMQPVDTIVNEMLDTGMERIMGY